MRHLLLFIALLIAGFSYSQDYLKPYKLGGQSDSELSEVRKTVKSQLTSNGLTVIGEYAPAEDKNRWVIAVTSNELIGAVKTSGGLTGFAAAWRVALTRENGKILISYNNPEYWGNAYFRTDFSKVSSQYSAFDKKIMKALSVFEQTEPTTFGSKEGLTVEKLHRYRYMLSMPRFDNTKLVYTFASFEAAKDAIEQNFGRGISGIKKVYSVEIPGKDIILYGVALSGEKGEAHFLPIIDIGDPKHTAFLPYEFLLVGKEVHMLHGRYRIALSFPDLKMGTFTKIMSTPNDLLKFMNRIVIPNEG